MIKKKYNTAKNKKIKKVQLFNCINSCTFDKYFKSTTC